MNGNSLTGNFTFFFASVDRRLMPKIFSFKFKSASGTNKRVRSSHKHLYIY